MYVNISHSTLLRNVCREVKHPPSSLTLSLSLSGTKSEMGDGAIRAETEILNSAVNQERGGEGWREGGREG